MHKAQIPLLLVRDRHSHACVGHNSDISTSQTRDPCERPQPGLRTPAPCAAMAPGPEAQRLQLHAALMPRSLAQGNRVELRVSVSCPALRCADVLLPALASEPRPAADAGRPCSSRAKCSDAKGLFAAGIASCCVKRGVL